MARIGKAAEKVLRVMYVARPEIEVCEDPSAREVALGQIPGYWRFRRWAA
jgi:hypothetical protein